MQELNRIINEEMPGRPRFQCEAIQIGGESFDFFYRDIIPCIRALFGDPTFAKALVFAPEHHYQDVAHTKQLFSEMHTGKWWWSVQVHPNISSHCLLLTQLKQTLELRSPGATVIPVIISSDKTQLTHF